MKTVQEYMKAKVYNGYSRTGKTGEKDVGLCL
jgi:hypothetical protein